MKDCIVLMQGMFKFNKDLQEVVRSLMERCSRDQRSLPNSTLDVNDYISISAIGYALTKMYGCFDGLSLCLWRENNDT